jgi:hypothetical protein
LNYFDGFVDDEEAATVRFSKVLFGADHFLPKLTGAFRICARSVADVFESVPIAAGSTPGDVLRCEMGVAIPPSLIDFLKLGNDSGNVS